MTMLKRLWLACGLIASYGIAIFLTRHIAFATETSLWWTDATGDGGPYSQDEVRDWMEGMFRSLTDDYAVIPGIRQELFPFSTGTNNVSVLAGQAIIDGTWYQSDATDSMTITSPGIGTTGKRIVLQKDWTAQTIRLVEITSADGTATIPTLTQTDGVTWEEPVCQFTITTGGVIGDLTDERLFPGGIAQHAHSALSAARNRQVLIDDPCTVHEETAADGIFATAQMFMHWVTAATIAQDQITANPRGGIRLNTGSSSAGGIAVGTLTGTGTSKNPIAADISATELPFFACKVHPQDSTMAANSHQEWGLISTDRIGSTTVLGAASGAYFVSEAAGQLIAATENAASNTQTALGAVTGFTSQDLWEIICINIAGTPHVFFLNDRKIVADHTTNLPTGVTLGMMLGIRTGTTSSYDLEEMESVFCDNVAVAA